jgi:hypothetical protein
MRLIPVDTEASIPTNLRCSVCGLWRNSGELYADLDGTPFQAYYCRTDRKVLGGEVELLGHIAHEIEQQALSYANAGAPLKAFYLRAQVASLREAAVKLRAIPYPTKADTQS